MHAASLAHKKTDHPALTPPKPPKPPKPPTVVARHAGQLHLHHHVCHRRAQGWKGVWVGGCGVGVWGGGEGGIY